MLSYSRSGPEREIELTELLDRDAVFAQTGADAPPPSGRHPLAPYVPWADEGFILKACGAFAAIAIVMALVVAGLGGDQVLRQGVTVRQLPASYEFELTNASRLVEVRLQSDVLNAYALFSAEVTGPNGEPVAIGARVTERYSGVEGGERWTEGSGRSSFRFRPETTGLHRITVDYEDGEGWRGNVQEATNLNVDIRQGVGSMIYLVGLAIIFAIGAAITVGRRALFQRLRWAGSDWSDD